jgi:hypothetical protein
MEMTRKTSWLVLGGALALAACPRDANDPSAAAPATAPSSIDDASSSTPASSTPDASAPIASRPLDGGSSPHVNATPHDAGKVQASSQLMPLSRSCGPNEGGANPCPVVPGSIGFCTCVCNVKETAHLTNVVVDAAPAIATSAGVAELRTNAERDPIAKQLDPDGPLASCYWRGSDAHAASGHVAFVVTLDAASHPTTIIARDKTTVADPAVLSCLHDEISKRIDPAIAQAGAAFGNTTAGVVALRYDADLATGQDASWSCAQ